MIWLLGTTFDITQNICGSGLTSSVQVAIVQSTGFQSYFGLPPPENAMIALSRRFGRHFALWPLTGETNYEGGEEDS